MPTPSRRSGAGQSGGRMVLVLVLASLVSGAVLLEAPSSTSAADAPERGAQRRFMWAMAGQESGWDYYARNASSGAFGKYQIMPVNWPVKMASGSRSWK